MGAALAIGVALLSACHGGPSESEALELVRKSVREDGSCMLPAAIVSKLEMQYASKGVCVPLAGADKAKACIDALVAAGLTRPKPSSYMVAWPDEVAGASLKAVPASARHARNLDYSICVEMAGHLREGRFPCADAHANDVLDVKKAGEGRFEITYEREIALGPKLAAIEAACGEILRPPVNASAIVTKGDAGADWVVVPPPAR